jgi:hypothetical protein
VVQHHFHPPHTDVSQPNIANTAAHDCIASIATRQMRNANNCLVQLDTDGGLRPNGEGRKEAVALVYELADL